MNKRYLHRIPGDDEPPAIFQWLGELPLFTGGILGLLAFYGLVLTLIALIVRLFI